MTNLWAGEWYSRNRLDGTRTHLLYDNCLPCLFKTRKLCREYIQEKYGYIKDRKDLRDEPHGWRLPRPIKVRITPEITPRLSIP